MLLAVALTFISGAAFADIAPPRPHPRPDVRVKKPKGVIVKKLVGELTEGGVERCLADWTSEWAYRYPVVGFTPLKPADGVDFSALYGALVVVEGGVDIRGLGPLPKVEHEAPCAPMQMRSDWVRAPRGMRVQRPGMGRLKGAFKAERVAPWRGLRVEREGDEVVVTLENTFSVSLVTPKIRVHYEGCFGKPGTTSRVVGLPELVAGDEMTARFPLLHVDPEGRSGRRTFRAASVQIESDISEVVFDLDWPLSRAGIDFECPDQDPGRK